MGNLSSCCFDQSKDDDINERTRILENPIGDLRENHESFSRVSTQSNGSHHHLGGHHGYGTINGSGDSSALNNALHKMANSVIDVSSIDVPQLEQGEWQERQKNYSQRVQQLKTPNLILRSKQTSNHNSLNKINIESIDDEDVKMINYFSDKTVDAIKNGFIIKSNESFVVQFDP